MAGQNRSSYARPSNGANRGLAAFFRGAFILLVALTLSFGLGFFVIARMVPSSSADGGTGGGSNAGGRGTPSTGQRTQHPNNTNRAPQIAAKSTLPSAPAQGGPEILPETEVQKPDPVGSTPGTSSTNGSAVPDPSNSISHGSVKLNNESSGSPPSSGAEASDSTNRRHSRRSRTPDSDSGSVQAPASPDSAGAQSVDSPRIATADSPSAAKSGLYRVQIGVYSTREKAEEIARSASDKGLRTTVHVVNQDGRTLYRVQRSVHRDRTKAEQDRQTLMDAGFDATIINPSN